MVQSDSTMFPLGPKTATYPTLFLLVLAESCRQSNLLSLCGPRVRDGHVSLYSRHQVTLGPAVLPHYRQNFPSSAVKASVPCTADPSPVLGCERRMEIDPVPSPSPWFKIKGGGMRSLKWRIIVPPGNPIVITQ